MKLGGLLSVAAGLVLLGLCLSQWNADTGPTATRAFTGLQEGDRQVLASLRQGPELNDTMRIGIEAVAGIAWLTIGIALLKRAANPKYGDARGRGTARR